MANRKTLLTAVLMAAALALSVQGALADDWLSRDLLKAKAKAPPVVTVPSWMSPDVGAAWTAGYKGQGVTITMVDEFSGRDPFSGNLGKGKQTQLHGLWTTELASMIASSAKMVKDDFNVAGSVKLAKGLNVLNLSYAMYATAGYSVSQIGFGSQELSIINYAQTGKAVIVKAAGNDAVVMGSSTTLSGQSGSYQDYLGDALIGAQTAIFAGALDGNGTTSHPVGLSYYSDTAGSDPRVQSHFLSVGVPYTITGLAGTSFAAPTISGYAAVLGSKFTKATPTQIVNQLLTTARTDTLINYNAATYGVGEASLSRALAPKALF